MRNLWALILLFPILHSCKTPRYVYAPSRVNAPLLQQKKEVQLDASISTLNGFDASAAYALTSHIGLMVNGNWRNDQQKGGHPRELLAPTYIHYQRRAVDFGFGWFSRIGSSDWHVEIYTGLGKGKFSFEDVGRMQRNDSLVPYSRVYTSKINRLFIQPAVGINSSRSVQFVLFTRFQFQRFLEAQTDYSDDEMQYYLIPQNSKRNYSFVEPGFSFRFYPRSLPVLGFETTFLFSNNLNGMVSSIGANLSFGIHARFPPPLRKMKPS